MSISEFYDNVFKKPAFWMPLAFLTLVAFGFSTFNRTINWDDLLRDHYDGSGNISLSGRWGMVAWVRLLGITDLSPFVDRFTSVIFMFFTACALSCIFYHLSEEKERVLPYLILSSTFITYPLINEIWEYANCEIPLTGGLFLVTLAAWLMQHKGKDISKILCASLLMVLPMSSYESSIFYYVALVFMILFYRLLRCDSMWTTMACIKELLRFFTPVVLAFLFRVLVSVSILCIYDLGYAPGGDSSIHWFEGGNIFNLLRFVGGMTFIKWGLASLIYFPIAVFVVCLLIYAAFVVVISSRKKQPIILLIGLCVVLALFSQTIIQGGYMPYRTAQTIPLFVSFVAFMVCEKATNWKLWKRNVAIVCLLGLCWHQAVYLNNLLSLNNLRSDNEMTILRDMGRRMVSDYDKKPVVFVSSYSLGPWINERVKINRDTWNGKLYADVVEKFVSQDMIRHYHLIDKIVETNVGCTTEQYAALKNYFAYCGYDIDVVGPIEKPHTPEYLHKDLRLLREATKIAKAEGMRPYQIKDAGDYLIVTLSNELYYLDIFEQ